MHNHHSATDCACVPADVRNSVMLWSCTVSMAVLALLVQAPVSFLVWLLRDVFSVLGPPPVCPTHGERMESISGSGTKANYRSVHILAESTERLCAYGVSCDLANLKNSRVQGIKIELPLLRGWPAGVGVPARDTPNNVITRLRASNRPFCIAQKPLSAGFSSWHTLGSTTCQHPVR